MSAKNGNNGDSHNVRLVVMRDDGEKKTHALTGGGRIQVAHIQVGGGGISIVEWAFLHSKGRIIDLGRILLSSFDLVQEVVNLSLILILVALGIRSAAARGRRSIWKIRMLTTGISLHITILMPHDQSTQIYRLKVEE